MVNTNLFKGPCKQMQQVIILLHVVGGDFGQQFCIHLHRPKSLTGFKLCATSANIVVVPCKWTQHVVPTMLHVVSQQCCILLANNVASICMGLNTCSFSFNMYFFEFKIMEYRLSRELQFLCLYMNTFEALMLDLSILK